MAIIKRQSWSHEMEKNTQTVGRMTGGMGFTKDVSNVNWKSVRVICNLGYSFMPREKGVRVEKINLNNISAEISTPRKMSSENIIMYIHGGGFVSGSPKATRAYCSMLAKYSGCRVISIAYSLAPEYTWPAPVDDCYAAYLGIRKMYPNAKIALTGESAGGNLVLATTIRLLNNQQTPPACLVPHSPVCDFSLALKRDYYKNYDITVSEIGLKSIGKVYCPDADTENPELSPIYYKHFELFPPTVITSDSRETLRADADALYQKLESAGVACDLYQYDNTFHAFAPIGTSSPETMQLMLENIEFIKKSFANQQ